MILPALPVVKFFIFFFNIIFLFLYFLFLLFCFLRFAVEDAAAAGNSTFEHG